MAVVLISGMRTPLPAALRSERPAAGFRAVWLDLKTGIRYIAEQRSLLALVLLFMALNFASIPVPQLLGSFTERVFQVTEPQWAGWLWSGMTAGIFLGAFVLSSVYRVKDKTSVILAAVMIFGAGELALGLGPPYLVALLTLILMGLCMGTVVVLANTFYQTVVPGALLGRFFANIGMLTLGLQPLPCGCPAQPPMCWAQPRSSSSWALHLWLPGCSGVPSIRE